MSRCLLWHAFFTGEGVCVVCASCELESESDSSRWEVKSRAGRKGRSFKERDCGAGAGEIPPHFLFFFFQWQVGLSSQFFF